jgi:hypothetical protein
MKEGAVAVPIHVDLPVDGKSTGKGSISKRSEGGSEDLDDEVSSMELEQLVEKEVKEWRNQVDQSQAKSPLRHRKNVSGPAGLALDEVRLPAFASSTHKSHSPDIASCQSNPSIPYNSLSPTLATRSSPDHTLPNPLSAPPETSETPIDLGISVIFSETPSAAQSSLATAVSPSSNQHLEDVQFEILSASSRPDTPLSSFSSAVGVDVNVDPLRSPMSISDLEFLSASSDAGTDLDVISVGTGQSEHGGSEASWTDVHGR